MPDPLPLNLGNHIYLYNNAITYEYAERAAGLFVSVFSNCDDDADDHALGFGFSLHLRLVQLIAD
jgi:hypothetical protein